MLDVTYLNSHFRYPSIAVRNCIPDTAFVEADGVDDIVIKISIELWSGRGTIEESAFESEDCDLLRSIPVTIKRYTIISIITVNAHIKSYTSRYANTIPLLDLPTDISCCQLYHALRTFNWIAFGHRMRDCNTGSVGNIVGELIPLNKEHSQTRDLTIIVDLNMPSGNLTKHFPSNGHK